MQVLLHRESPMDGEAKNTVDRILQFPAPPTA